MLRDASAIHLITDWSSVAEAGFGWFLTQSEMYDEDISSEGGSKGSYEIFKAEGDVLFKKEEFQKALTSYTTVGAKTEKIENSKNQLKIIPWH